MALNRTNFVLLFFQKEIYNNATNKNLEVIMYFLIKGRSKDNTYTDQVEWSDFEWITEADNEADAIAQLEDGEDLVDIREISVEERIKREEQELLRGVKSEYISKLTKGLTLRQMCKQVKELDENPEIYYLALKSFNKRERLTRILKRQNGYGELSITEYTAVLNKLIDAHTEEDFNKILTTIGKKR